jgi:hypothetical protein
MLMFTLFYANYICKDMNILHNDMNCVIGLVDQGFSSKHSLWPHSSAVIAFGHKRKFCRDTTDDKKKLCCGTNDEKKRFLWQHP